MSFTKIADAMARAYRRGEIDLSDTDKQIAFSDKLKQLEPRKSGYMGMLSHKPFASGAEGEVYYGSMRGKGLGVRKIFGKDNIMEGSLDSATVRRRAKLMNSIPDAYPEVYRYEDGTRTKNTPNRGIIDMEHVPIKKLTKAEDTLKAYTDVYNAHKAKGFEHVGGFGPGMYDKKKDVFVGDLHTGNVVMNARTGKGVILDPLVYKPLHDKQYTKVFTQAISAAHEGDPLTPPDFKNYTPDRVGARSLIRNSINNVVTGTPEEAVKSNDAGIFGFAKQQQGAEIERAESRSLRRRKPLRETPDSIKSLANKFSINSKPKHVKVAPRTKPLISLHPGDGLDTMIGKNSFNMKLIDLNWKRRDAVAKGLHISATPSAILAGLKKFKR